MEPKILVIGRLQSVLNDLASKLGEYNRDILVSVNSEENIQALIENNSIDFVVIGAGLPDEIRAAIAEFINSLDSNLSVHLIDREGNKGPQSMIPFVNNYVGQFKKQVSLGK